MATNRNIVATRKLNKKNKARLGRGGDTKIRKVDGKDSHVNALEAYLIDVDKKAGEEYAKRVGSGTTNPLTGMPEYQGTRSKPTDQNWKEGDKMNVWEEGGTGYIYYTYQNNDWVETGRGPGGGDGASEDNWFMNWNEVSTGGGGDPFSYENLSDVTGKQLSAFDPTLGVDDVKYFQDIFSDKPFEFLGKEQALATKGLESAYGATMGALGSQQAALGRTTGRGLGQAAGARDIAASKSGLATSGTITQGYETQKKELLQDYTTGIKDIGREKGTALETLQLGKEGVALDLETGTYAEQQKQLDEYWDMIGMRQSAE
jgi:hypothetical protein